MGYDCPFCPCVFASKSDLERHLDVFGRKERSHWAKYCLVHDGVEYGIYREHGGADKVIRDLARIILKGS